MRTLFIAMLTLLFTASMAWAQDPPGPEDDIFVDEGAVITQVGDGQQADHRPARAPCRAHLPGEARVTGPISDSAAPITPPFISQVGHGNNNEVEVAGTDNTALLVQEGHGIGLNLRVTEGSGPRGGHPPVWRNAHRRLSR